MQQDISRAVQVGEFYELEIGADVAGSSRFNEDIAPTKISQRTWNEWHIAALWVGMAICVPTYTLGGVLTTYFGLSVGEALWAVFIANVIVLIPLILNAFAGTKFGIPFPVMLRSAFGIVGSNIPALIRALVACGWFGIQTLFGGIAVHLMLSALSTAGRNSAAWAKCWVSSSSGWRMSGWCCAAPNPSNTWKCLRRRCCC